MGKNGAQSACLVGTLMGCHLDFRDPLSEFDVLITSHGFLPWASRPFDHCLHTWHRSEPALEVSWKKNPDSAWNVPKCTVICVFVSFRLLSLHLAQMNGSKSL